MKRLKPRKASCVNARGILTATYQALHLLSCTRGRVPHPCWGYPTLGTPILTWPGATPSLLGGTPPWVPPVWTRPGYPHPDLAGGGTPPQVPPCVDLAGIPPIRTWLGYPPHQTWLGYPSPLSGPGRGTSHMDLAGVPPIRPGWGTPPPSGPGSGTPPVDGQTDRHVSKHKLPVVLRTRSVKLKRHNTLNVKRIET